MNRRGWKLFALLFVLSLPLAWPAGAQEDARCAELQAKCSKMADWELLSNAYLRPDVPPGQRRTYLGTCYYHDRAGSTYPYRCDNYVKLSQNPGAKGYDGGTGCIWEPDPEGKDQVARLLRELCVKGACCCPNETYKECPGNEVPVKARDPITKTCCDFANACSLPEGWQVSTPGDTGCP